MVFTFIVLWLVTIILIVNNPRNESTRWVALVTFCGGAGGFGRALIESFMPYLSEHELMKTSVEHIFPRVYSVGSFINTYGLPYCYFIFCLCYSELLGSRAKVIWKFALLIPVLFMFYITPIFPKIIHHYGIATLWVAPYIVIGSGLLIYTYIKESNPLVKKNKLITLMIALPPVLFQLISNYILRLYHVNEAWRLNAVMMFILLVLFLIFMIKFDFFGVKLKFERRRIDSTLKAVTSGTSFLNHAIKNEIGKINILSESIKHLSSESGHNEISTNASHILASTDHLLGMINRIQNQIQDVYLQKETSCLSKLIQECVTLHQPLLKKFSIQVEEQYAHTTAVEYDQVHIREVINNIFINAIDAMKTGGVLKVQTIQQRNQIDILVIDSGTGIPKHHLDYIFDPFYTTKVNNNNFGLGLSYCFNIINKHGGKIEVFSELGSGTTMKIGLPITS